MKNIKCTREYHIQVIKALVENLSVKSYISDIIQRHGLKFITNLLKLDILEDCEYKAILNCRDTSGNTLLHHAIKNGFHSEINKLIMRPNLIDLNAQNDIGYAAIHNIIYIDSPIWRRDIILTLCNCDKFNVGIKDPVTQFSILFKLLFEMRDFETARLIITLDKSKKDKSIINETNSKNQTMLHIAANAGRSDIMEFLLKGVEGSKLKVNKLDAALYSPLLCAIFFGNQAVFTQMLLDQRVDCSITLGAGHNIFHLMVCRKEALPILQYVIRVYNSENNNDLCISERVRYIVNALINEPNQERYTPFALAIIRRNYSAIHELMSSSIIKNYYIYPEKMVNALHYVAMQNDIKALEILNTNSDLIKSCINQIDHTGKTPVQYVQNYRV